MPVKILTEVFKSAYTGVSRSGDKWVTRYLGKYIATSLNELEAAEKYDDAVRKNKNMTRKISVNFPKNNEKKKYKRRGPVDINHGQIILN